MTIKIYQLNVSIGDINNNNSQVLGKMLVDAFMGKIPTQKDFDNNYIQISEITSSNNEYLNEISDLELCEYAFHTFNSDDRPDGHLFRSMSVGDIVDIDNKTYICSTIGFKRISLNLSNVGKHENIQHYDFSLLKTAI